MPIDIWKSMEDEFPNLEISLDGCVRNKKTGHPYFYKTSKYNANMVLLKDNNNVKKWVEVKPLVIKYFGLVSDQHLAIDDAPYFETAKKYKIPLTFINCHGTRMKKSAVQLKHEIHTYETEHGIPD